MRARRNHPDSGPGRPANRTAAMLSASQREMERRAGTIVRHRPEPPAVLLDDGPADREAHSQTTGLRGVERLEHPGRELRIDAGARILHRDTDPIGVFLLRADDQLPPAALGGAP